MVCRIRALLEARTNAKVYVTMEDPNQQYAPTDKTRFAHDTDEVLLMTPPYPNQDAKVSAQSPLDPLQCDFRARTQGRHQERNILFASIHCNSIGPRLRGMMVYVPGERYRDGSGRGNASIYDRYEESRNVKNIQTTSAERKRDEALSRVFAKRLVESVSSHTPSP